MIRRYFFRALGEQQQVVTGSILAASKNSALQQLLAVHVGVMWVKRQGWWEVLWKRRSLTRAHKILFFRSLEELTQAGVPLLESLQSLWTSPGPLSQLARRCGEKLKDGQALSEVLEEILRSDPVLLSLMRAGEQTGRMAQALHSIRLHMERAQTLQEQWCKAVRYPAFVLILLLITGGVLCDMLLPSLLVILQENGRPLPWMTRGLVSLSGLFQRKGLLLLAWGLALGSLWRGIWALSPVVRLRMERLLLASPLWGTFCLQLAWAHFFHLWGLLAQHGVSLPDALEEAGRSFRWMSLSVCLQKVRGQILEGCSVCQAFTPLYGITPATVSLLTLAEKTGRLPTMLLLISELYQQAVQARQERWLAFFEPGCLGLLGLLLLALVGGALLPLYGQLSFSETVAS